MKRYNRDKLRGKNVAAPGRNDGETRAVAAGWLAWLAGAGWKKERERISEKEKERKRKKGKTLNPCKKEERVSSLVGAYPGDK